MFDFRTLLGSLFKLLAILRPCCPNTVISSVLTIYAFRIFFSSNDLTAWSFATAQGNMYLHANLNNAQKQMEGVTQQYITTK
jgi:hypothetical protein